MKTRRTKPRRQRGLTLIEQLMTVAVLAVLAGLGLPSFVGLLSRHRLQTSGLDLFATLQYARATAITQRRAVIVCPTVDARQCSNGVEWTTGWLVGADHDRDGQIDDAPLRSSSGHPGLFIHGSSGRRLVRFLPDGSAAGSNLTLSLCTHDGHKALKVIVSNAGRVRMADQEGNTCG
ncbi:type IV fimbrial biogenesis protein FimT [Aerosticca soli]|uniref:Type II secretion system protein H n=2 Tax=Aerosticca soli TaxID=2010829 RepID=A0A2Z6E5L9_9GAMM|nr:type IV fimbrial biogenesis protein FimT [Aerosticca soli]